VAPRVDSKSVELVYNVAPPLLNLWRGPSSASTVLMALVGGGKGGRKIQVVQRMN